MTELSEIDINHHLGKQVRDVRNACGVIQTRLAEEVGITRQQLSKMESGINIMSAARLWKIARALGVAPGLFFETLPAPREPEKAA